MACCEENQLRASQTQYQSDLKSPLKLRTARPLHSNNIAEITLRIKVCDYAKVAFDALLPSVHREEKSIFI